MSTGLKSPYPLEDFGGFTHYMTAGLEIRSDEPDEEFLFLEVAIHYRVRDPYALVFDFNTKTHSTQWTIDRDLLTDGLHHAVGEGDVDITPDLDFPALVWLGLSSPTGIAKVQFARTALEHVVAEAERLVPTGTESDHIDWDGELAAVLAGGQL